MTEERSGVEHRLRIQVLSRIRQHLQESRCSNKEMKIRTKRLTMFMKSAEGKDFTFNLNVDEVESDEDGLTSDLEDLFHLISNKPYTAKYMYEEFLDRSKRLSECYNRKVLYIEQVIMSLTERFGYLGIIKEPMPSIFKKYCNFVVGDGTCAQELTSKLNRTTLKSFETCLSYKLFFDSVFCMCVVDEVERNSFKNTVHNILTCFIDSEYLCEFGMGREVHLKDLLLCHPTFYGLIRLVVDECVIKKPNYLCYRNAFGAALNDLRRSLIKRKVRCKPATTFKTLTRSALSRNEL